MKSPQTPSPVPPAGSSHQTHVIGWTIALASILLSFVALLVPQGKRPDDPATIEICFVANNKMLPNGFAVLGPGSGALSVVGGRVQVSRRWEGETIRLLDAEKNVVHQFVLSCRSSISVEVTVPAEVLLKASAH